MSNEAITLADDLDKAGMDARAAGQETFKVEMPWRAGVVIADALRNYFSPHSAMRCAVCDSARSTAIDVSIDVLADEVHKLGYVMSGIESLLAERAGLHVPSGEEARRERIRTEIRTQRLRQPPITLDETVRARVVP
jgi:hypothetical protein